MPLDIEGRRVFTEVSEVVDPRRSVLVVLDMENHYCHPDGWLAQHRDIHFVVDLLPRLSHTIATARNVGIRAIVYVSTARSPGERLADSYRRSLAREGFRAEEFLPLVGSWDARVIDALTPEREDLVLHKLKANAFADTHLDSVLHASGAVTVILAGLFSHSSVESTARSSAFLGYHAAVLTDCIAAHDLSLHECALRTMETRVDLLTSVELGQLWTTLAGQPR
jgi:ureidoacrylate peracid hydrolase